MKMKIDIQSWSNYASIGYMISALQKCGLNQRQIQEIVNAMKHEMDLYTLDEAKGFYLNSPY